MTSTATAVPGCDPIDGNPDFYGLGIRIGVYLQWFSAWASLLVDPQSAQSIYDVNSVFVFAAVIATIIAKQSDSIQPIETYIMLQLTLGFFVTTLSTFGVRLYFLRPSGLHELGQQLKESASRVWKKAIGRDVVRSRDDMSPGLKRVNTLLLLVFTVPTDIFSPLKPYHLSWSGVLWRTSIAAMVAGVNVAFWFGSSQYPQYRLPGQGCGPPFVFMFSKQQLSGPMVNFCKTVSVLIAIVVFPPALVLLRLTIKLHSYAVLYIYREYLYIVSPEVPRVLRRSIDHINAFLAAKGGVPLSKVNNFPSLGPFMIPLSAPIVLPQFSGIFDILEFLTTRTEDFHMSDVVKLFVSLGSGRVEKKKKEHTTKDEQENSEQHERPRQDAATPVLRIISYTWNVCVMISIVWFIVGIEMTLAWNNIQGVWSIDNTGQLIPFIIGCVSTAQVLKKLVLFGLAKKYPDWADVTLEASLTATGPPRIVRIVESTNSGSAPEESAIKGDKGDSPQDAERPAPDGGESKRNP